MRKYLLFSFVGVFAAAILFSLYVLLSVVSMRNHLADELDKKHPGGWLSATAITHDFRSALLASFGATYDPCTPGAYWKTSFFLGSSGDQRDCRLPRMLSYEITSGRVESVLMGGLIVARLPQESVLAELLNRTYFGHSCNVEIHGVPVAAKIIFHKAATELSFGEMAELFALAHDPALTAGGDAAIRAARDAQAQIFVSAKLIDAEAAAKIVASPVEFTAECAKK